MEIQLMETNIYLLFFYVKLCIVNGTMEKYCII